MENFIWQDVKTSTPPIEKSNSLQNKSDLVWLHSKSKGVVQGKALVFNTDMNNRAMPRKKGVVYYTSIDFEELGDVTHWMPSYIPVEPDQVESAPKPKRTRTTKK